MLDARTYSAIEGLRDGRRIEIRAFRPEDREGLQQAAPRVSATSIYRRFFGPRRKFSEKEKDFFLNVDFEQHVALVAVADESGRRVIVATGRYIVVAPGKAEVAFMVIDAYQGQGIGAAMLRHLIILARTSGLQTLTAEVLSENAPMLKLFKSCGLPTATARASGVVHVDLALT
jgi:RimJ/RimL family protein N-acetyltransferase